MKTLFETDLKTLASKLLQASETLDSICRITGFGIGGLESELKALAEDLLKVSPNDYRLNSGKEVAVSTSFKLTRDMAACPRGVKVLLLSAGGVLVIGQYVGEEFWQQWAPLPRRAD